MKKLFTLLLFVIIGHTASATHLMGGEIRTAHVSGQTFRISVHVYLNIETGGPATTAMQTVPVCFGDGATGELPRVSLTTLPDKKYAVGVFEKNYTYPSSGIYQISSSLNNRSGSLNIPFAETLPLFLWTVLDTQLSNVSPILSYPIIEAGVRQVLTIDLKAEAADNDSITFRLQGLSRPSPGTCGVRSLEQSFFYPNDLTKNGTFKIDSRNKKLIWNAPERIGTYLYAFVADEWRDGVAISQSYHEGMIIVTDRPGDTVQIPPYEPAGPLVTSTGGGGSPEMSMRLQAYPVPTDNFLNFKVTSKKRAAINVQLINLKGIVVKQIKSGEAVNDFENQFDMRQLTPGVYVIRAENSEESISQKVIR